MCLFLANPLELHRDKYVKFKIMLLVVLLMVYQIK